jgi:hypothetical protein
MLKKSMEPTYNGRLKPATIWKACKILYLTGFWLLFLGSAFGTQSIKEYIYLNGKTIAVNSEQGLRLPISLDISDPDGNPHFGFAGLETVTFSVSNNAGLTLLAKMELQTWDGLNVYYYESYLPLDANGQLVQDLPQDATPGTYVITAVRYAGGWTVLDQPAYYVIRPPKPWVSTAFSPLELQLPASAGTQWLHSANMRNQYIDIIYYNPPPGYEESEYILPLSDGTDPDLYDNGGNYYQGAISCDAPAGTYEFYAARNAWDPYGDLEYLGEWDNAWTYWGEIVPSPEYIYETYIPCQ